MKKLLLVFVTTTSVHAGTITLPTVDDKALCGKYPEEMKECMDFEQKAYDHLKIVWPKLSNKDQAETLQNIRGDARCYDTLNSYATGLYQFSLEGEQRR